MLDRKCPMCGTHGRVWNREPEVFLCPNCSSFFSDFGLVLESGKESANHWN